LAPPREDPRPDRRGPRPAPGAPDDRHARRAHTRRPRAARPAGRPLGAALAPPPRHRRDVHPIAHYARRVSITDAPGGVAPRIQPSILSADFANMQRDVERIASADGVHVDVMDNHFVPNLTFGPAMVEAVQRISPIPLDVHLMIEDADRWAPGYAELGVFSVTFHAEATNDPVALARRIRDIGSRASIALKPGT